MRIIVAHTHLEHQYCKLEVQHQSTSQSSNWTPAYPNHDPAPRYLRLMCMLIDACIPLSNLYSTCKFESVHYRRNKHRLRTHCRSHPKHSHALIPRHRSKHNSNLQFKFTYSLFVAKLLQRFGFGLNKWQVVFVRTG